MSDNLIIVTLPWEKADIVYRRWLVRPAGATTKPADVLLPRGVRLNCSERLVLGKRLADPERSERRGDKNDIVVWCALAGATDTTTLDPLPKMTALINRQSYYVLAPRGTRASRSPCFARSRGSTTQWLRLGLRQPTTHSDSVPYRR